MVEYPTSEYVIRVNASVTAAYGQKGVVLQSSNLEHYLDGMRRYAHDIKDERAAILRKGAYILYHLAYDAHAFLDGNKRTSISVAFSFLDANLENFDDSKIPEEEKAKIVKEIANGKHTISFIEKWLQICMEE
ncbi:MAG: Fic family protein [Candidatus Micrarchaeota archaeon]